MHRHQQFKRELSDIQTRNRHAPAADDIAAAGKILLPHAGTVKKLRLGVVTEDSDGRMGTIGEMLLGFLRFNQRFTNIKSYNSPIFRFIDLRIFDQF